MPGLFFIKLYYRLPKTFGNVNLLLRAKDSPLWDSATVTIFDAPSHFHLKYEERKHLLNTTISDNSHIKVAHSVKITDKDHLTKEFEQAIQKGLEGVVLRKPASYYYDPHSFYKLEVSV